MLEKITTPAWLVYREGISIQIRTNFKLRLQLSGFSALAKMHVVTPCCGDEFKFGNCRICGQHLPKLNRFIAENGVRSPTFESEQTAWFLKLIEVSLDPLTALWACNIMWTRLNTLQLIYPFGQQEMLDRDLEQISGQLY